VSVDAEDFMVTVSRIDKTSSAVAVIAHTLSMPLEICCNRDLILAISEGQSSVTLATLSLNLSYSFIMLPNCCMQPSTLQLQQIAYKTGFY